MFDNPKLNEEYVRWRKFIGHCETEYGGRQFSFDGFLTSDAYRKYTGTSTIYSCDDEAERGNLEVPLQWAFTSAPYVLSAEVADVPLTKSILSWMNSKRLLNKMNRILRTDRKLTAEMRGLLRFCCRTFHDFGQAYACLRPRWHMDPSEALKNIEARRREDEDRRRNALEDDVVVDPKCPPRRLWDLPSNRVAPFWALQVAPCSDDFYVHETRDWLAISHSWMEENRRHYISSPVNSHEWPIPIPTDTSLERIRIELLNIEEEAEKADGKLGVIGSWQPYNVVWLDVVCLRQEGVASNESLRKDEWKLDVPTIGPIYSHAEWVAYYFSGLGRPFETPTDKNDPRHWMNRAWTLQETQENIIVAGRSPSSPKLPHLVSDRCGIDDSGDRQWERCMEDSDDVVRSLIAPFKDKSLSTFPALLLMRSRSATSEVDKIAGLIYCFNGFRPPLPAYIVNEDVEDAWNRLVKASSSLRHELLLFVFSKPGTGKHIWYPSWQQIMDMDIPDAFLSDYSVRLPVQAEVSFDETTSMYSIRCVLLERCWLEGLEDVGSHNSTSSRSGIVRVTDKEGKEHICSITADHRTSIPNGHYDLVGALELSMRRGVARRWQYWVVARKTEQGSIKKVSVIRFEGEVMCEAMDGIAESFGHTTVKLL